MKIEVKNRRYEEVVLELVNKTYELQERIITQEERISFLEQKCTELGRLLILGNDVTVKLGNDVTVKLGKDLDRYIEYSDLLEERVFQLEQSKIK